MISGGRLATLKTQWPILLLLALLTPMGLATKIYQGPMQEWVHAYAGDVFYAMFWYFLIMLFFPRARPALVCLFVFFFSTAVELTQLSDAAMLVWMRQFFLGRTLVGSSFSVMDILYYYIGSQLAVLAHLGLYLFFLPTPPAEPERQNNAF